jgi:hypothetical protein
VKEAGKEKLSWVHALFLKNSNESPQNHTDFTKYEQVGYSQTSTIIFQN